MNTISGQVIGIVFVLLLIIDVISFYIWKTNWFKFSLIVFKKEMKYVKLKKNRISISKLENDSKSNILGGLVFKQISYSHIAFREKIFDLSLLKYSPIVFGSILINEKSVVVIGKLFWAAIALFSLGLYLLFIKDNTNAFMILGLIVVLYLFHLVRLLAIVRTIEENFLEQE